MAFNLESVSEATSGAIGALVSTTILYPLDTCKSKYQAEVRAHHQAKYRWIFLLPFQDFSHFPFFFFFCSLLDIFLGPTRDEFGFIFRFCWVVLSWWWLCFCSWIWIIEVLFFLFKNWILLLIKRVEFWLLLKIRVFAANGLLSSENENREIVCVFGSLIIVKD